MNNKSKPFFISLSLFLVILTVFTCPLVFKITKQAYGSIYGTDNRAAIRDFWFARYAFLNGFDFRGNDFISFPFGISLKEYSLLPFWLSPRCLFSVLVNEIFSYNFLIALSFFISFLGMYLLTLYLTGSHLCSFLAGIIFSLCPYHFNKAWEHYSLTFIDFFPFSFLYLLKVKDNFGFRNFLFAAVSLALVIISDLSYAYIICIGVIVYFFYGLLYAIRRKEPLTQKLLFTRNLIFVGLLVFIIALPAILPVIRQMFFTPVSDPVMEGVFIRPFKYLFTQSARPLSYLLPASSHPVFGKFTESMFGNIFYGRNSIEHTLYLGWIPILLGVFAWKMRKKNPVLLGNKQCFAVSFFGFLLLAAFLFSLPPYINLGFFKIYLPSFFMYKIIPMFRAYARFGILVTLSLSVLAAFGLRFILVRVENNFKKIIITAVFSLIILFEFINIPPFRTTDLDANVPGVYSWLAKKPDDFAIIEYPLEEGGPGESYLNLDYLFYQRVHHKRMVNGALPGSEAYRIKEKIRKITDPQTPEILEWLGVKYVIVHSDIYRETSNEYATDIIGEVPNLKKYPGFKLIKKFKNTEVFEIVSIN